MAREEIGALGKDQLGRRASCRGSPNAGKVQAPVGLKFLGSYGCPEGSIAYYIKIYINSNFTHPSILCFMYCLPFIRTSVPT